MMAAIVVFLARPSGLCDEALQPNLTIDLLTLGCVIPKAERDVRAYDFLTQSVAFIDEETLAVSFFERNDEPGLSRRDGTPGRALVFSTVLLDPITGHLSGQLLWGNAGYWNLFLPLANGNFFVQSDEWLAIYSKEFRQIARKRLEIQGELLPRYSVSPDGNLLHEFQDAYDTERNWLTKITLLDSLTLERKQSELTPGHAGEKGLRQTGRVYGFESEKRIAAVRLQHKRVIDKMESQAIEEGQPPG